MPSRRTRANRTNTRWRYRFSSGSQLRAPFVQNLALGQAGYGQQFDVNISTNDRAGLNRVRLRTLLDDCAASDHVLCPVGAGKSVARRVLGTDAVSCRAMTGYSFLDDYSEGCHPAIIEALSATNMSQQTAYGNDDYTSEARRLISQACGRPDVAVYLVSGGTLANLIICAATLRPHEAVISADSGHMAVRETGAIEAVGHKIITMPSTDGKLRPADIDKAVVSNAQAPHMAKPRMVYVSNATEFGTVYSLAELAAIRAACDVHELLLLVDGARLGVALAADGADGLTLETLGGLADIFWIGGTKAGTLFGEAIVIPNASLAVDFAFHLKQRGALLAKGRSLGVQFQVLFSHDLFLQSSRSANAAALTLSDGVVAAGFQLAARTESNQVFASLPNHVIEQLQPEFGFYIWEPDGDDHSVVRLVTSWATDSGQVDRFVAALQGLAS